MNIAEATRRASRWTWPSASPWGSLAILAVIALVVSLDRQIITLMGEPLRVSLGLSDTQLGVLQGVGISFIAGIAALAVGWFNDRHDVRIVLIVCLAIWAMATVIGANSRSYVALFLSSAAMGLLDTAMAPIVYGFIPRVFPEQTRALANSVFAIVNLLCLGFGFALAGEVVKVASALSELSVPPWGGLETWRAALLLAATGAALCVALVPFLRTGAPPRVAGFGPASRGPSMWPYVQRHRLAMSIVFGAFGLGGMGLSAVTTWVPVIAQRSFGAAADEIASSMAVSFIGGIVIGGVCGTFGLRLLQRRFHEAAPVRIMAAGCLAAAAACALLSVAVSPLQVYVLLGVMVSALIAGVVLAPTMMQDMADPRVLSQVVALGTVVSTVLTALGAPCVGIVSDVWGADPRGILIAVSIVGFVALLTAAMLLAVGERPYLRTVAAARGAQ